MSLATQINNLATAIGANIKALTTRVSKLEAPSLTSLSTSGGTAAIDCSLGETFQIQLLSATQTVSFTNVPSTPCYLILEIYQGFGTGGPTLTWPTSVKWSGGVAYTPTSAYQATDVVGLVTFDGGTSWQGVANKGFA
jgi:hypothetical protein